MYTVSYQAEAQKKIMILQVRNVTGQIMRLEIDPEALVLDLKQLVENTEHYALDTIGLEFSGKILENDRKISDYHLQNESTLHLVRPLSLVEYMCWLCSIIAFNKLVANTVRLLYMFILFLDIA